MSTPPLAARDDARAKSRILIAHNHYRSGSPSGENIVVERETTMLTNAGLPIELWHKHSDDLGGIAARIRTACNLLAPDRLHGPLTAELRARAPSVLHAHNVWPQFTYGLFRAAADLGIPTVQTLHNFRLIATNTHLLFDNVLRRPVDVAERLHLARLGGLHGRFANMIYNRAIRRTWREHLPASVRCFICLSDFQRRTMIAAGIPAASLVVKPNFLADPGTPGDGAGGYALFVGRLAKEKGIIELVRHWPETGLPLWVVGDGPQREKLAAIPAKGVKLLGRLEAAATLRMMREARFMVMNSNWYEGFPLVLVEALAAGTPCLVPDIGGLPEIIRHGKLGFTFEPGAIPALISGARKLWDAAPALRAACRLEYEEKYTPAVNLRQLTSIYDNLRNGRAPGDGRT